MKKSCDEIKHESNTSQCRDIACICWNSNLAKTNGKQCDKPVLKQVQMWQKKMKIMMAIMKKPCNGIKWNRTPFNVETLHASVGIPIQQKQMGNSM